MMFAHVTDGQVDQVGGLPALVFDDGRWWDLRPKDPALLASLGWYEVTEADRPADTETATSDLSYVFADGAVTQTWTVRDKTPEELAADAEQAAWEKFTADTEAVVRALVATAQPPADGLPYVAPTGYHNAYAKDTTCTHNGKTWRALRDGAVGEPGVAAADWQEVPVDGEPVDWVQPQAGSEYPVGAIVRHNGRLWRNDLGSPNGFEPGVTHSGWTDLGPAD